MRTVGAEKELVVLFQKGLQITPARRGDELCQHKEVGLYGKKLVGDKGYGDHIAACAASAVDVPLQYRQGAESGGVFLRRLSGGEIGWTVDAYAQTPDLDIVAKVHSLPQTLNTVTLTDGRMPQAADECVVEEHLLELQQLEAVKNRALLSLELVIALSATVTYLVMLFAAIFAVENIWWRMALILVGGAFLVVGIVWALRVEHDAGYYECPHCQYRYVPTMKAVVLAPHIGRDRRMKCPRCGKKGYHKKVLTK